MLQVSDRPYFDYNLASRGRPNRFILTESCGEEREGAYVIEADSVTPSLTCRLKEYFHFSHL